MTRRLAAIAALGVIVLAAGSARADDQEKLQGVWKAEKVAEGGVEMSPEDVAKMSMEFKGNKATPHVGGRDEDTAEFTFDGSKNPKTIDFKTAREGTALGIYEFDGDTLKLCFAHSGGERPTKFESPAGSKIMYLVLKKQAK